MTLPQVRAGLASQLRAACGCDVPVRIVRDRKRWLTRNALARFYHWKKRNLLAPLRINLLRCKASPNPLLRSSRSFL